MAGELGLKNTFKQRVFIPHQQYLGTEGTASRGPDRGLEHFMQTRAINEEGKPEGLKNSAGQPLTMTDIFMDLGKDPRDLTLDNILAMGDEMRYLAPELIRDFILKGMESRASYLDLVAGVENVPSMEVSSPWIKYANETPVTTGEAETIAEATMTWGKKTVTVAKKAIGIYLTDELLLSVKVPILRYFLRKVGVQLSAGLFTQGVQTMINGDQSDGSDACVVVGTTTGSSTQFEDFVRVWVRGDLIGQKWGNLLNSEAMANKILKLSEFKTPQGAGTVVTNINSKNRIIPSSLDHLVSSQIPAVNNMLYDQQAAMIMLVFRGLLIESERIIMRQIQGTACSTITGYTTVDPLARVMLKEDWTYAAHAFPADWAPLT
jgi:hypothetical protein